MYSLVSAVFRDVHAMRETVKLLTNGSVGFFFFFYYFLPGTFGQMLHMENVSNETALPTVVAD